MRIKRSNRKALEARVAMLEQLVGELSPLACEELLHTAKLASRFMHEGFDWRQRAERAEAEIDCLARAMVADAFPDN